MKNSSFVLVLLALFAVFNSANGNNHQSGVYNTWRDAKNQRVQINDVEITNKVQGEILKVFVTNTEETRNKKITDVKVLFKNKQGKQQQQTIAVPFAPDGSYGCSIGLVTSPETKKFIRLMMLRKFMEMMKNKEMRQKIEKASGGHLKAIY